MAEIDIEFQMILNVSGVLYCELVSGRLDQRSINRRCYGTIAFGRGQLLEID